MSTAGTIAAIVAAVGSITALVLAFWWRRPRLEIRFPADPAEGAGTKVFQLRVDNVGPAPVRMRISVLVDGSLVGEESDALIVAPPLHRMFQLALPLPVFAQVEAGARLSARVRYGLRRTAEVERGARTTV
jgi:hypothetical protein